MGKDRLLIFTELNSITMVPLLQAFLKEAALRPDVEVAAVCDSGLRTPPPVFLARLTRVLRRTALEAFNNRNPAEPQPGEVRVCDVSRRAEIPILIPPGRNINSPGFIEQLRIRWQPTLALSFGCRQVFCDELLGIFDMVVNYHDGYLPEYKGRLATAWSLYCCEKETGYTFHRMTADIDAGPILLQNLIPIPDEVSAVGIYCLKARRASQDAGEVLDLMRSRCEGASQRMAGRYFSAQDGRKICTIDNPSLLTASEIHRRLRAFEILRIRLGSSRYPVTAVRLGKTVQRLSFASSDGVMLTPSRFMYLPPWLYRVYHVLRERDKDENR